MSVTSAYPQNLAFLHIAHVAFKVMRDPVAQEYIGNAYNKCYDAARSIAEFGVIVDCWQRHGRGA